MKVFFLITFLEYFCCSCIYIPVHTCTPVHPRKLGKCPLSQDWIRELNKLRENGHCDSKYCIRGDHVCYIEDDYIICE